MIEEKYIAEWGAFAPWNNPKQVELDLIISRAMIEMFNDPFLCKELRMRGGTALNKLHFPNSVRYSEDIDLVRTELGPIGPSLDHIRAALEPWLGKASFSPSSIASKLRFRIPIDDAINPVMKLKVEINTSEVVPYDPPVGMRFEVTNSWFSGVAVVPTYSPEEMLSSKLRALLQRNKGRDLFDVAYGLTAFENLDLDRLLEGFLFNLRQCDHNSISRAEAESRMFAKLVGGRTLEDIQSILPIKQAIDYTNESLKNDFSLIFSRLIVQLPGTPWKRTREKCDKFGIQLH